ncbi:MAG: hypothetical protein DMG33_09965 [Acidobacteria bacterium]|nr:MAG: hypothetical protein DMG33_09965 [Acidobacteriota bacterium]
MLQRTIRAPALRLFLRILLLIVGTYLIAVMIHDGISRPVQVELPKGYRGWVVINYEDPSCPHLGRRGLFLVISISSSGHACTSESASKGWQYVRYESRDPEGRVTEIRQSGWGGGGLIWAESYPDQMKVERFFVGSEHELNSSWVSKPKI